MKKLLLSLICNIALLPSSVLFASEITAASEKATTVDSKEFTAEDIKLLSQAYGHMIGQNLNAIGLDLDSTEIIKGIQAAFNGAESPLEDSKTIEMITTLQERKFKNECDTNLRAAEAFLASNSGNEGVVELEKGKLQYKQLSKGEGKECTAEDTPVITYTGKYLNGEIFGQSEKAEPIALNETIAGFQKAILGMKVGEKREVYIHPDLGYGTSSCLSPNALLTFEIELKGMEEAKTVTKQDYSIGGMADLPNEDAFADGELHHEHVK